MGFREITDLRKSGNLDAALTLALQERAATSDDYYITSALAWVYRDMLKNLEVADKFHDFVKIMTNIFELGINLESEDLLSTALRWHIINIGWKLIKNDNKKTVQLKRLLELAINIPAIKGKDNSVLLKMFVKAFKDDRNCYYQLVDWQGFDNFAQNNEQDDYSSEVYNNRETPSLVESYFGTYCKHLLPEDLSGQVIFDAHRVDKFIPLCADLILKHPEYKWLPYYMAQLQSARGNRHEALKIILPFVRAHKNDFWAWERLGDFLTDPKDKLSCYCKGAQCRNKAEMLIGLRKKLIPYFISFSELEAAKYEIEQIIHIRNRNEWDVPQQFIEWQNAEWFSSTQLITNNVLIYEKYSVNAEELLYGDIDLQDVLIIWKDDQKQLAGFVTDDRKCGAGIFRGDVVKNLVKYNVYSVKIIVDNWGNLEPLTKPVSTVNEGFRRKHIAKKDVIVLWVDREKHLAGFLIEDASETSTTSGVFRSNDSDEVFAYSIYSVELIKNQKGDYEAASKPIKTTNKRLYDRFIRPIEGFVRICDGNKFGFISDAYISPQLVQKYQLLNGDQFTGIAVRGWNTKKNEWSWRVVDIDEIDK